MADIPTNCGELTPQTYEIIKFQGSPDVEQGHIPYFHSMLCKWAYNIAQQFSFVILIEAQNESYLLEKLRTTLPKLEPVGWNTKSIIADTWKEETQGIVGCIFANSVSIPGETLAIENVGISEGSRRGFINAPIINGRSSFEPLQIGFTETNQSFVDGVLRPWVIVTGHEGLLARKNEASIKATIQIYQLARAMDDETVRKNIIRKHWTFEDCVPIQVAAEELTYGSTADYGKRQVHFVYNNYTLVSVRK